MVTVWSRPWQVILWETIAWSGRRFLWMKTVDPPPFTWSELNVSEWKFKNNLQKQLIFSRVFLGDKVVDVVPGMLWGSSGAKEPFSIPRDAPKVSSWKHTCPWPRSRRTSSRQRWWLRQDQGERNQDDQCLCRVFGLLSSPGWTNGHSREKGPAGQHVVGLKKEGLWQISDTLEHCTGVNMDWHKPAQIAVWRTQARGAVRAVALCLGEFTMTRKLVIQGRASLHTSNVKATNTEGRREKKKRPLLVKRWKGGHHTNAVR